MGQNFLWKIWRDGIKVFWYCDNFCSCGLKNRFRKIIFSLVGLIKICVWLKLWLKWLLNKIQLKNVRLKLQLKVMPIVK